MRGLIAIAAAVSAIFAAPLFARSPSPEHVEVIEAVDGFFAALRSEDKTALARTMRPDGVIFIHDRRDPDNVRILTRPVSQHLNGWEDSPPGTDEYMRYDHILVDGTMAQVWGPYVFLLNGETTHCGINSMSLAKGENGWLVSNTSFTMVTPEECDKVGAPELTVHEDGTVEWEAESQ
ncbi:hypothetical protein [Erythrobacter sp. Alg231-14]|uniref:hypothetical protein n=1 Tax=Erythrobacter sp. Alg231-14 TaxID=1922225 RepID=UPI000D5506CF